MEQNQEAFLPPRQPQQPDDLTGGTSEVASGAAMNATASVSCRLTPRQIYWPVMDSAWNWVCKNLDDILPGFQCLDDTKSGQAMKASLTSLGATVSTRNPQFSRQLYCWAQKHVETACEAEPGAPATMIALYGLALTEMATYGSLDENSKGFNHLDRILYLLSQQHGELEDPAELRAISWLKSQIAAGHLLYGRRVRNLAPTRIAPGLQTHPAAHGEQLALILGRLCSLQADICEKKFTEQEEITHEARAINEQLSHWERNLPQYSNYSESMPGASFPDTWECLITNLFRCAQIVLFRVILSDMPNILRHALQSLASEIIASVPFYFRNTAANQSPIHCMAILPPLVLAATAGYTSRESVKSWLRDMNKTMNIGHISRLLNVLESEEDITKALQMPPAASTTDLFKVRTTWPFMIREVLLSGVNLSIPDIINKAKNAFPFVVKTEGWENSLLSALYNNEGIYWRRQEKDDTWWLLDPKLVFHAKKELRNGLNRQYMRIKQDPKTVVIQHTLSSRIEQMLAPHANGLPLSTIKRELQQYASVNTCIKKILRRYKGFTESNEGFWKSTDHEIVYDPEMISHRRSNKRKRWSTRAWTKEEDTQLMDGVGQNESFRKISNNRLHGRRSDHACYQRYQRMLRMGLCKEHDGR